jgi:hypothetical protein
MDVTAPTTYGANNLLAWWRPTATETGEELARSVHKVAF